MTQLLTQVVGVLLIAKADLELTNRNKSSALHLAVYPATPSFQCNVLNMCRWLQAQLNNTDAVPPMVHRHT